MTHERLLFINHAEYISLNNKQFKIKTIALDFPLSIHPLFPLCLCPIKSDNLLFLTKSFAVCLSGPLPACDCEVFSTFHGGL